ncbi:MAG: STAS domain-containing protein [Candidatus Kapabacteria bacterium]|nr:STAS domain-containing protein [Candidatus Kapabacteria bacterium]
MADFSTTHRTVQSIHIIDLNGYLDAHTAPILEKEIGALVEQGMNAIIVNFRGLDYISSAGLGVFMVFIEQIRDRGGDIKLAAMTEKVFTVFDLLGFPMLFDITDTEDDAIVKFTAATT